MNNYICSKISLVNSSIEFKYKFYAFIKNKTCMKSFKIISLTKLGISQMNKKRFETSINLHPSAQVRGIHKHIS